MAGARSKAEQGRYESYLYPNTGVLKNKFDIRDAAALDRAEAGVVLVKEVDRPPFKSFSLKEMQSVHKHLLSEVYAWAGQVRDYTTGRDSASFARPEFIESYFGNLQKELDAENFLRGTTKDKFAERSAYYVSEINAVHPFIDGNGRTTRMFLKDLAEQAGHQLSIKSIEANKGAWYEATAHSFRTSDTSKVREVIRQSLEPFVVRSTVEVDPTQLSLSEKTVLDQSREFLKSKGFSAQFSEATIQELDAKLRQERIVAGRDVGGTAKSLDRRSPALKVYDIKADRPVSPARVVSSPDKAQEAVPAIKPPSRER
jgi:cell filamentation protein